MDLPMLMGLTAGFVTTSGFIPQILKGYRTGSMKDVSLTMPIVLITGMTMWLIYGIYLQDIPIIFWNSVAIVLNVVLVVLKIRSNGMLQDGSRGPSHL